MNTGSSSNISRIGIKKKKEMMYREYLETYDLENIISEMTNSVVHSQDPNPIVYMIKYLTGLLTEEERTEFKINIDPPYPQGVPIVKFPEYKTHNILSKYLTKSNWYNYKYLKTSFNNDINNLTCLSENSEIDKIGIVLVDKDCINTYQNLIEKVIYEVHNIDSQKQSSDKLYSIGNSPRLYHTKLFFYEGLKTCLKQIRFIFYRNIEGYTYNNYDKRNGKLKEIIEQEMLSMKKQGYLPQDLEKINRSDFDKFINSDEMILKEYKWMNNAGFVNKNYSNNERSIWANKDKYIIILINFSNHFEIILTCDFNDELKIQQSYNYVMELMKQAKVRFTFDTSPRYGYITSNVSLLGAGFEIVALFEHKNIKKREGVIKNINIFHYSIKSNNQIVFSKHYHLDENTIFSFVHKAFVFIYGIKTLCDHLDIVIDKEKIRLKNSDSPVTKAYESSKPKTLNEFNLMGKNINEVINYYKQTEKEEDLFFSSAYCYFIFDDFIFKYILYRDNINLEISNYLERPEKPKNVNNIEASDFLDTLLNLKIYLSRNINDFPFPLMTDFNSYNIKALDIIKNALDELNKKKKIGTMMTLEEAKDIIEENGIKIFHNDERMKKFGLDGDFPKNRGFIKFEKPNLFATINDLNNINFILAIENIEDSIDFKTSMENLIVLVNKFSAKIKFAFSHKFGFLTACPKYVGNGMYISADLKIKNLDIDFFDKYLKGKNITYELIKEDKREYYKIIRLTNTGSFNKSETEMLCDWLYYLNEIILEESS